MLRVCHIISGDLWAGAETMAWNLLRKLQEVQDVEISVVILNEGRLAVELQKLGLRIKVLDERRQSFATLTHRVRAFTSDFRPEIIHSHRYKENILAFFSPDNANRRIRLVATQHGLPEGQGSLGVAGKMIAFVNRRILAHRFDRLIGVSSNIRTYFIQQLGARPDKVLVIHNGIELPAKLERFSVGSGLVVGAAGRLSQVKDYPLMIAAARKATEKDGSLRFELAGEGPERAALEKLVAVYGLSDNFRFRGHVEDMNNFYSGLDVCLNTSLHEGIPMSILEAMAHGLPVIAPHVGGLGEIIEDGVEGFLVCSRNPEDFAEKCLLLKDAALRRRMGDAARKRVEDAFSAEHMARQYYRVYQELSD
jgi:glycosyltransferase involved in cell wall biosynthesis